MTYANDNETPYTVKPVRTVDGLRYEARFNGDLVARTRTKRLAWFMCSEHKKVIRQAEKELPQNINRS